MGSNHSSNRSSKRRQSRRHSASHRSIKRNMRRYSTISDIPDGERHRISNTSDLSVSNDKSRSSKKNYRSRSRSLLTAKQKPADKLTYSPTVRIRQEIEHDTILVSMVSC
eukprot:58973_1